MSMLFSGGIIHIFLRCHLNSSAFWLVFSAINGWDRVVLQYVILSFYGIIVCVLVFFCSDHINKKMISLMASAGSFLF